MKTISVRFTDGIYNKLKTDAVKEKRSINAEINMIVEKQYSEIKETLEPIFKKELIE